MNTSAPPRRAMVSGLVFPLDALPAPLATAAQGLPAARWRWRRVPGMGWRCAGEALAILVAWAAGAVAVPAVVFRWE